MITTKKRIKPRLKTRFPRRHLLEDDFDPFDGGVDIGDIDVGPKPENGTGDGS